MEELETKESCLESILDNFNGIRIALENVSMLLARVEVLEKGNSTSVYAMSIADTRLGLSKRALHILQCVKCDTVGDIVNYGVENLANVRGCGRRTIYIIRHALEKFGVDA